MYAVILKCTFDADVPTVLFNDYDEAVAYLNWWWNDCYDTEKENESRLEEEQCFNDGECAQIKWKDGDCEEFILTDTSEPDKRFLYKKEVM